MPQVSKMKDPFTINEYGMEKIKSILLSMQNKADLLQKYTSANLTAKRW